MDRLSRKNEVKFDYKLFVINMAREKLYERINKRVDIMLKQGLIDEVKGIIEKYDNCKTSMQALGYKETKEYLDRSDWKRRDDRENKKGEQKICKKTTDLV